MWYNNLLILISGSTMKAINWKSIQDGYEIKIYFNQGQDGILSIEELQCSLQEEEKFQKLVQILEHLKCGIDKYFQETTEKVAGYIAQKTGLKEEEVLEVIMNLVLSDIKFEEQIASVNYIEISRYENGTVKTTTI